MSDTAIPAADAAAAPVRELPFGFTATGGEYFRIWIVNLLLSICTLGIYSAWAKVRRLRYFYGSTSLDGAAFDYHGNPVAILKGRLIALGVFLLFRFGGGLSPLLGFVLLPVFVFGLPWIVMRSRRFHLRMTSWRGLRFHFHGDYAGALGAYVGWMLLGMLSLGLLTPVAMWKRSHYLLSNAAYGTERFRFTTLAGRFYGIYFRAGLLGLGMMLAAVLFIAAVVHASGVSFAGGAQDPAAAAQLGRVLAVPLVLVFVAASVIVGAYFKAAMVNATIGGLELGPHRLRSELRWGGLALLTLTNLLGILFTLGLFAPWARVRLVRYQLQHTHVIAQGDLGAFTAAVSDGSGPAAEEIGEFFDMDFGL